LTDAAAGEAPYRVLAGILIVAGLAISVYHRRRAERAAGPLRDGGHGPVLLVLRGVGILALLPVLAYLVRPSWVDWARMSVPAALRWLAGAVGIALLPVLVWIFRTLGLNISPSHTTRRGHRLVTDGPYRFVRHPLYTTGTVLSLALALVTALWWPVAWLLPALFLLHWRTPREEERLIEAFGDAYRDYRERTGRYLPRRRPR
jgi:protein-S-isoprenylcysteine O-methyltransferase Ste14